MKNKMRQNQNYSTFETITSRVELKVSTITNEWENTLYRFNDYAHRFSRFTNSDVGKSFY